MRLRDLVSPDFDPPARVRVGGSFAGGALVGVVLAALDVGGAATLIGWDTATLVYLTTMWWSIWPLGATQTARRALRDDPGKVVADTLLLSASVVSLVAVGVVLVQAGNHSGGSRDLLIGLGVVSVVLAWGVVHTVYALRYARLYYAEPVGGVDFNEQALPRYSDFAYLSLTIGMTFQVSDTDLKTKEIRQTAIRHALLSYVFGAVIIATTINLVAGLTTK
jgi:uncharacterized membrane protein